MNLGHGPCVSERNGELRVIRVFVIDANRLLGEALSSSLECEPDMEAVGCCETVEQGLVPLRRSAAQVVLINASVDLAASFAAVVRLRSELPKMTLLPIGLRSEAEVVPLVEAGASGYVMQDACFEQLVRTIAAVHGGEPPCSPQVVASVCARIQELARSRRRRRKLRHVRLTAREQEVLCLVAEGMANKEIAGQLCIRVPTVKNHMHSILEKFGARGRRDALRRAYQSGLLLDRFPQRRKNGFPLGVLGSARTVEKSYPQRTARVAR